MVKVTAYLRIAKASNGKFMVKATSEPNYGAISTSGYNTNKKYYPTIHTEVELDIDEKLFAPAKLVIKVKEMNAKIAGELK
jgi:hypothetical protein